RLPARGTGATASGGPGPGGGSRAPRSAVTTGVRSHRYRSLVRRSRRSPMPDASPQTAPNDASNRLLDLGRTRLWAGTASSHPKGFGAGRPMRGARDLRRRGWMGAPGRELPPRPPSRGPHGGRSRAMGTPRARRPRRQIRVVDALSTVIIAWDVKIDERF